jgi:twitching motility two-component system response regulator PilH
LAKILIAGEDLAAMANIEGTIAGEGHEVLTATDGLDAYTITLEKQADLVFLEVSMPVFNGFETCTMIRDDPEIDQDLPVVFLTNAPVDAQKIEKVGATDQLPKTHLSVELQEMLVRHLGEKAVVDTPPKEGQN